MPRLTTAALLFTAMIFGAQSSPVGAQTEDDPVEARAQGGKKNRKEQNRPIKLGTSGGSLKDRTLFGNSIACCGGTLGGLVEKNGNLHILSNNHVIARANKARRGEAIAQPSYLDQTPACQVPDDSEIVANLTTFKRIKFGGTKINRVDAAIAKIVPGTVNLSGRILNIGIPGTTPVDPAIGMEVKKSGRTSGLTRGVIFNVDAVVDVTFEQGCGTDVEKTARFVDQILISGSGKKFSKSGDSGSMVYRNVANCPAPVGLLFAGNESFTAANPIKKVQNQLGKRRPKGDVNFVGCTASAAATSTDTATSTQEEVMAQDASEILMADPEVRFASRVLARRRHQLMTPSNVFGIGVGLSSSGPAEPVIHIFADRDKPESWSELPSEIDGVRTEIVPTGPFLAYCDGNGAPSSN